MQKRLEVKGLAKQDLRGFTVDINRDMVGRMPVAKSEALHVLKSRF